jgi:hypothetical protein
VRPRSAHEASAFMSLSSTKLVMSRACMESRFGLGGQWCPRLGAWGVRTSIESSQSSESGMISGCTFASPLSAHGKGSRGTANRRQGRQTISTTRTPIPILWIW